MLTGYVLRYLAAIATGGSTEGAAAVVPAPLRALARRAAQKHVIAAGFDTTHADDIKIDRGTAIDVDLATHLPNDVGTGPVPETDVPGLIEETTDEETMMRSAIQSLKAPVTTAMSIR